jgi:hypothetical protein
MPLFPASIQRNPEIFEIFRIVFYKKCWGTGKQKLIINLVNIQKLYFKFI